MVAYSFNPRFVDAIVGGTKQQTIRGYSRKRHAEAGDGLQLYCGQRTQHCYLIGSAVCSATKRVLLNLSHERAWIGTDEIADLDAFARMDGFERWFDMRRFWKETHPNTSVFTGVLIRWEAFLPATTQRRERLPVSLPVRTRRPAVLSRA